MILTVTPNPMLDKTIWVSAFAKGAVHRGERLEQVAGGKGLNVARALVGLGEATLATGFLGGWTGNVIRSLLDEQNIPQQFIEIAATTREGFTFVARDHNERTAVFEPGPPLQLHEVEALQQFVHTCLPRCRALALCGSMPSAGFDTLYANLIQQAHAARVPVFLDSYLAPLKLGLQAEPQFLKPNREEALQTFGLDARKPEEAKKLFALLKRTSTRGVFITDAEQPVLAWLHGKSYRITPPRVACRNPLGGGDVFVAAFLWGWLNKTPDEELLRFAVAAGSLNAMHDLPGYANLKEIKALMREVKLEGLPE